MRLHGAEADAAAVRRLVDVVAGELAGEYAALGLRVAALGKAAADVPRAEGQRPVEHCRVHVLALAALPRAHEGYQYAHGRVERAAGHVAYLHAGDDGLLALAGREAQDAGIADIVDVVPGAQPVGPVLAEAGDGAVDKARVYAAQRVPAYAQPLGHAGAVLLDHDVRVLRQFVKNLLRLGLLEVEADAFFVSVHLEIRHAGAVHPGQRQAPEIAALGRFDPDHLRAEVGKQHRAQRPWIHGAEVKYPDALQRKFHSNTPFDLPVCRRFCAAAMCGM